MSNDKYTVISTMKNEGAFLIEWVAHHKVLGFDNLVICTNDCEDPTTEMVKRLAKMGLARPHLTRYRPGHSIQRSAFKQVLGYDEVKNADWLYVCDADEFLASRAGDGTARALVAAGSPDVEAICVPWRVFGTDGQNDYRPGRITQQFTRARADTGPKAKTHVFPKTLFRGSILQHLRWLGVHMPIVTEDYEPHLKREAPGGKPIIPGGSILHVQADYSVAQVNHYQLRSADSFLVKVARGKVNHVNDKMDFRSWARNDTNDVVSDMIRRYDAATEAWMADLLSDRRLKVLHDRAVRWHQEKVAELHSDPEIVYMLRRMSFHRARAAGWDIPPEGDGSDLGAQNAAGEGSATA
ncbi:MAG: glycosyltransferase family 2 protein [Gemmobacter sp.]|nr:glycosyltransferase family 2 protein [Gemmobacter sp.]